jgi:hypothetical protein
MLTTTELDEVIPSQFLRGFRPLRRRELSAAFDRVASTKNWKDPIDATVSLTADERAILTEAVIFYCGCIPMFEDRGGVAPAIRRYRVTAPGYYAAIGA